MKSKKLKNFLLIFMILSGVLVFAFIKARPANSAAVVYFTKEFVIKPLVRKIANSLENDLVNRLGEQISGIVEGVPTKDGPLFITNWRNYVLESQARGNDVFRTVLADASLCSHFGKDLKNIFGADKVASSEINSAKLKDYLGKLVNLTSIPGQPSFKDIAKCTLPSDFDAELFKKDFAKGGGWETWEKLIEPQNNLFGSYMLALGERGRQIETESKSSENEALAGGGFLSQKLGTDGSGVGSSGCVVKKIGDETNSRCTFMGKIVTPAQLLGESAANILDAKIKRVGAAEELTDVILSLADAVVSSLSDRLVNFIGQTDYGQAQTGGKPFSTSDRPSEDLKSSGIQNICQQTCRKQFNACVNSAGIDPGARENCGQQRDLCLSLCSVDLP